MRWVADFLYLCAGVFYLPVALYGAIFLGKNRTGWGERFGRVAKRQPAPCRIWVHAVSLGEINATPKLVEAIRERLPDAEFVFSTTTDTGYARAVQHYGRSSVFRFPLDFSFVISRVLQCIKPTMIVLVELEVWYNLVQMSARRGIPVVVVNGRLTERSFGRMRRLGPLIRPMFQRLTWVGAQEEAIADRFRGLGVLQNRVDVTGSLKWDTAQVSDSIAGVDKLARAVGLDATRPVWVCGSTGPGEESQILDAFELLVGMLEAAPQLVIVPRKPERFSEVANLIESRGFSCIRRSVHADDGLPVPIVHAESVVLGDTMGELRKFYSLARVVFVGRTLVPLGGSDPMEVAALGKVMIVGPHFDNFSAPVRALGTADAIRVVQSVSGLADTVAQLLKNESEAEAIGDRARQVVLDNQGATVRTADRIVRILGGEPEKRQTADHAIPASVPSASGLPR